MTDSTANAADLLNAAVGDTTSSSEENDTSQQTTQAPPNPAVPNPVAAINLAPPPPPQPPVNIPYGQLPVLNLRAGDPQPSSVIGPDEFWVANRPLPAPLGFQIPSPHASGFETRTLNHLTVNFANTQSVKDANHYTTQVIWRARQRLGLPNTRPATQGPYTQANRDFIMFAYQDYAMRNGGRRCPMPELWEMYHAWFTAPGEARTSMSLNAHIDRRPELKAWRDQYPW